MGRKKGTRAWNKGIDSRTKFICKKCKKEFLSYNDRKYCSLSCASKHKTRTKQQCENISKALKGNTNGRFCKGKIVPESVRQKISKTIKKLFKENPEYRQKIKKARATQKRVYESQHEKLIQQELTKRKIKFKKHRYMKEIKHAYQCDIFIEPKLVIEIDGEYWHNRPETKAMDLVRTTEMEEQGFTIIRINALSFLDKNYKIHQEVLNGIMESIEYEI